MVREGTLYTWFLVMASLTAGKTTYALRIIKHVFRGCYSCQHHFLNEYLQHPFARLYELPFQANLKTQFIESFRRLETDHFQIITEMNDFSSALTLHVKLNA